MAPLIKKLKKKLNQGIEITKLSPNNAVQSKVVAFFIEIKLDLDYGVKLEILIVNYKNRIIYADPNLSNFKNKIMYNMDTEFLIKIIYGRLLQIISNNNIINNNTTTLEVTIDLGKEITFSLFLDCFNNYKLKSPTPHLTFYNWKKENQELRNEVADTQIRFDLTLTP